MACTSIPAYPQNQLLRPAIASMGRHTGNQAVTLEASQKRDNTNTEETARMFFFYFMLWAKELALLDINK